MSKALELAVVSATINGSFSTYESVVKSADAAAYRGENEIKCRLNVKEEELDRVIFLLKAAGFTIGRGSREDSELLIVRWGV